MVCAGMQVRHIASEELYKGLLANPALMARVGPVNLKLLTSTCW